MANLRRNLKLKYVSPMYETCYGLSCCYRYGFVILFIIIAVQTVVTISCDGIFTVQIRFNFLSLI